ncbi:MAG: hypothetical protein D6824_02005 [Planctomycetota bacterium]|nr:MAG: hypothetical protein D6824_02005 [Planctomycetota bacterium]
MAKKKCSCPEGVPEWVVTFGDMMSLLLTFFILLAAFSELKQEREYQRVVTAVKEAFGYSGGVGVLPTDDPPLRSMIETLEQVARKSLKEKQISAAVEPGMHGQHTKVTRVREGLMFTIGGSLLFEPGSAELRPQAKEEIMKVAALLRGRRNKIEIRGHASEILPADSPYKDLRDLSYYRAKAVGEVLVQDGGLDPLTLSYDARGATEPVKPRAYSAEEQAENRRVEIVMTETMIDDLHPDPEYADEERARQGK